MTVYNVLDYHAHKISECLRDLRTDKRGLVEEEAEKRLEKHGPNEISEEKQLGKLAIFISQFKSALVYILFITGGLSLILGATVDAVVIFGAVLLNSVIGFFQENKANTAISKLKSLVEHKAVVLRDGHEVSLNSKLVVPGDIFLIKAGNRIPADARLIEEAGLQVNEAGLTGESLPSNKQIKEVSTGAALADRENMAYAGTMVVQGLGRAVVTATGNRTEIGRIAEMVRETKEEKTPLQLRLDKFSRLLGLMFVFVCALVVVVGLLQGRGFLEMVETGVALGVASIPEGLAVSVTFILALGMQQILKKKALTRKLVAAETLGSTTVICTDKTGTLTEGKMHVAHIVIGTKEYEVGDAGSRQDSWEAKAASLALQTGMMCNNAVVENPEDELASWRFIGSPTESALMSAAIQSGLRKEKLLKREPQIDELPFDSIKKYMVSLHRKDKDRYIIYEKGAPEILMDKSVKYFHGGGIHKLDRQARTRLNKTYEELTGRGLRVIGLAIREFTYHDVFEKNKVNWPEVDANLTFIGFLAIKDPLRPEAKETIHLCRQAGIKPVIITGDHKLTARAIASEIGLKVRDGNIVEGRDLDEISDEELSRVVRDIEIYARVSPHHKLRIVQALRGQGEVVAMTGDGINDSPALKAADIGISLGTGTDIAKETSDIVLMDNNFKTIVDAVEQGRVIFRNIRKVITYLISDSFSEIVLVVGSIMLNTPLAILPTQILWINIVNDGLPHFSIAFEKDHGAAMAEKPMAQKEPLLNREMKMIIFGVGLTRDILLFGIFYYLFLSGMNIDSLRTLMFATLGVKSLLSLFSLRSLRTPIWRINPFVNKYMLLAVLGSFSFLMAGVYWPPLQAILSTTADLDREGWIIAVGMGLFSIVLIEYVKWTMSVSKIFKIKRS